MGNIVVFMLAIVVGVSITGLLAGTHSDVKATTVPYDTNVQCVKESGKDCTKVLTYKWKPVEDVQRH